MKGSSLIQMTTSQCVNPVNTSDLFDKWRKLKPEESKRSRYLFNRGDISGYHVFYWSFTHSFSLSTENLHSAVAPIPISQLRVNTNVIS